MPWGLHMVSSTLLSHYDLTVCDACCSQIGSSAETIVGREASTVLASKNPFARVSLYYLAP